MSDRAPVPSQAGKIPVLVVTGFLGSGKTTLISRVLRDPAFSRTAVIVNEFGDVGLDHDLIASSDDTILTLNTGCLCCAVQSDLSRTLLDLLERREVGSAVYDRVLIETSGLSDPAPVLQGMMTDSAIAATHQVPRVFTIVDALHGETNLRDHVEARSQVALADRILISKTDLCPPSDHLMTKLNALNSTAPCLTTASSAAAVDFGFETSAGALLERLPLSPRRSMHGAIDTFVILRDEPLPAVALALLLQAVAEHCGPRLLRLKGLVAIHEMPGQPAVIHGVRHVVSAPEFLDRWPSRDEQTRIVFITRGVPRYFVARLLDAIVEEVCDEIAASTVLPVTTPQQGRYTRPYLER